MSHKPGDIIIIIIIMQRLTRHVSVIRMTNRCHTAIPAVTLETLKRAAANFTAW